MWQLFRGKTGSNVLLGRQGLFCVLYFFGVAGTDRKLCWHNRPVIRNRVLFHWVSLLVFTSFVPAVGELFQLKSGILPSVQFGSWQPLPLRVDHTTQYGREFWVPAGAKRKVSYPVRIPDKIEGENASPETLVTHLRSY